MLLRANKKIDSSEDAPAASSQPARPVKYRRSWPQRFFLAVGVVYWQYGGTLSLMPAWTADYFGSKNLGLNYGLVFLGWGIAFFIPQIGAIIETKTGGLSTAFYVSGGLLAFTILMSRFVRRPT